MKIVIIEDEIPALNRITKMVKELMPEIEIIGTADSISTAVKLFDTNTNIDLALMDIELADGQSFEIFNQTQLTCPIIFTTAYDEFALKAFKVNSIDYLLKPIDKIELGNALQKFSDLHQIKNNQPSFNLEGLLASIKSGTGKAYKQRFLVKLGQKLFTIQTTDISYFYAHEKVVYLVQQDGKKYVMDHSLEELNLLLDPTHFFHLNRKFIANLNAIESITTYFNGKLKVTLKPSFDEEVLVSREKATAFKNWLNQ